MSPGEYVLKCLFPAEVPHRLAQLVKPDLTLNELIDFKMNPVLNSNPEAPSRLAIAAPGEREEWIQRVATVFRSPAVSAFWGASPAHARLMLDTDGSRSYVIYNDDLQPPPGPLLAMSLSLPKGGPEMIVRSPELPPLEGQMLFAQSRPMPCPAAAWRPRAVGRSSQPRSDRRCAVGQRVAMARKCKRNHPERDVATHGIGLD